MSNRALRILIADDQHFHRMQIERTLNTLNYYRVAPVHTLEELLTLVEYSCESFDLLIINAKLAIHDNFDLLAFCLDNRQIDHALIYDSQHLPAIPSGRQHQVDASRAALPDSAAIKRLMRQIDPPRFNVPRPGLRWLPELYGNWQTPR